MDDFNAHHNENQMTPAIFNPTGHRMNRHVLPLVSCAFALLFGGTVTAQRTSAIDAEVRAAYPRSEALYIDLHQHPEWLRGLEPRASWPRIADRGVEHWCSSASPPKRPYLALKP